MRTRDEAGHAAGIADGIGLAHDAGNLLGAIRLYCDLLALPGVLRQEHRHYAEELRQLTARSGSLIDRLLRPACADERERRGAGRLGLAGAVLACRPMLETIAAPGALSITVEPVARGEVEIPGEALERILVNLTKNAAEASAAGGAEPGPIAIRVRAAGADGRAALELSVEDRGRGMEEDQVQAALTGAPLSPSAGQQARPGRGIGLRVVRELARRTDGELRMRSGLGQGTTVSVVWPLARVDGADSG